MPGKILLAALALLGLALAQLAVSAGVTVLYLWAQARLALSLQAGVGPRPLRRPKAWALALALWLGFALLYTPLLALLLQALPQLSGSLGLLVAAYTLLSRVLLPALRAMPHSVLEAARTLGAGPWRRLWRVEWPLLQPALRSGAALTLAAVIGEFGATLVLRRPEWTTLSLAIYERLGRPGATPFAKALALAVLLGLLAGGVFYLLDRGRGTVG